MTSNYEQRILEIGAQARNAARALARATTGKKNAALLTAADQIEGSQLFLIQWDR
jgi:gamma-glutamyl phosphate reductase